MKYILRSVAFLFMTLMLMLCIYKKVGYSSSVGLYSGARWDRMLVNRYEHIQWGTVKVSDRYSELQLMYSSCQTMSVIFWEYQ